MEQNLFDLSGIIFLVIYVAITIIPFWKLWSRTGHSGWWSLLMLIPLVNIVMLYVLAFKNWPAMSNGHIADRFS